ncbi:MAG: hypothetical protein ACTSWN_14920 [Promethearchaeota archaeon]
MVDIYDFRNRTKITRFRGFKRFLHYFTRKEISDLLKSWIALSFAFTFTRMRVYFYFPSLFWPTFAIIFPIATINTGLVFIAHELAHKFTAERYGYEAHYKSNDLMLMLCVMVSLSGFLFFAAGAVVILGSIFDKNVHGRIAAAGPLTNIIISAVLVPFAYYMGGLPFLGIFFRYACSLNAWIGLYNMLPFYILDGRKILAWNKTVFFVMIACAIALVIVNFIFI